MPVGVTALASAMARPRVATSEMACSSDDHAGEGRGGELADRVAGEDAPVAAEVAARREERRGGDEPGRDDERLGDGGVLDRVGVGLGAVRDEVVAGGVAERGQLLTHAVELEPRGEEAGGLGALSRADDR